MNNFFLILKGFIIGVAKIMPGVSGAILSISFGVYERILYIISHPFKVKLDDLKFLLFFAKVCPVLFKFFTKAVANFFVAFPISSEL